MEFSQFGRNMIVQKIIELQVDWFNGKLNSWLTVHRKR